MKKVIGILKDNREVAAVLLLGLILRLFLVRYGTYYPDLNTFQEWSLALIRYPFSEFYSKVVSDYLPGYLYILWLTGKMFFFINAKLFFIIPEFVYKFPSVIADILNSILVFFLVGKTMGRKKATAAFSVFILNMSLISNSVLWGQVDSVVLFFLLSSLLSFVNNKYFFAFLFAMIGQTVKPIAILILPFLLITFFGQKIKLKKMWIYFVPFIFYILLFIPFSDKNIFSFVFEKNIFTSGFWKYTTLNAFNFWLVASSLLHGKFDLVSDGIRWFGISYSTWGYVIFLCVYLAIIVKGYLRRASKIDLTYLLNLIFLTYLSMFHFFTRMHERHVYYALAFASILVVLTKNKFTKVLLLLLSIPYLLNIYYSYFTAEGTEVFNQGTIVAISFVNFILYLLLLFRFVKEDLHS